MIDLLKNNLIHVIKNKHIPIKSEAYFIKKNKKLILKRRLKEFIAIFAITSVIANSFIYSITPLIFNPLIGIAYVIIFLRGKRTITPIFLGILCGYISKNIPIIQSLGFASADLSGAYLAVIFSQKIFDNDIEPFNDFKILSKFALITALTCCLLASLIRTIYIYNFYIQNVNIYIYFFSSWLSQINGLWIIGCYLLTWVYLPKDNFLFRKLLSPYRPILYYFLLSISIFFSLKNKSVIYFFPPLFLLGLWISIIYKTVGATCSVFVLSTFVMTNFMIFNKHYSIITSPLSFIFYQLTMMLLAFVMYTLAVFSDNIKNKFITT